jgi:iron complex outermembrane recepter protein
MSISRPQRALQLSIQLACAGLVSTSTLVHAQEADPDSTIETVVVSASPITPEDKLATIVETVKREQILRAGGASLVDALANTPGVTATDFGAGASRPIIRGFDANRVRVLESGIGSFDVADVGPDHGIPIDPLTAERIEVVRGAATLRYGSQAIGGVVNAINNRVPTRLPDSAFGAEVTGLYGWNADTRQASALLDGRLGALAIHADGFKRNMDDYETPEGVMPNSFYRGDGYSLGGSYFFGKNHIGAAAIHYDSEYGIPAEEAFIDMKQDKALMRASFAPGVGALQTVNVEGGIADYEHSELDPGAVEANATFRDKEWEMRAEGVFGAFGPFSAAAFGVQFQDRDFSALGEAESYLFPTSTSSSAAFAFVDAPLARRTHLHAGARLESVTVDGTPASDQAASRDFTPLSASVGVLFDASDSLRFGFTLSSAARAPAQTELYSRGPHEGSSTFETGDPDLSVERANSLEATLQFESDRIDVEGALWAARFDDYVFGALTGRTCSEEGECVDSDEEELRELDYSQADTDFRGAELKVTFHLHEAGGSALHTFALADYVRATFTDGGNVPRIPPYHVGAGLDWNTSAVSAGALLKYTGQQKDIAFGDSVTSGFVSVDAHASWKPLDAHPDFELTLVGRNLTDSTQRSAMSLNKDEVILPGREVRLLVRAKL